MLKETQCEVCGNTHWKQLGQRTYNKSEVAKGWHYGQKRFKVLFDKWFPMQNSVTLTSLHCNYCGFVIYQPRPEKEDIDIKYRYLEELGQDYGGKLAYDSPHEKYRSKELLRYIKKHIDLSAVNSILDYGGGDGRLMQSFRDIGKVCYLVDYNQNCIPGIKKISDTVDGIPSSETFDLIICSHVIEHVAQPLQVIKQLSSNLSKNGNLFVEVPMEVWKKPPLHREPVTHINFFTPNSTNNLLHLSGLELITCEMKPSSNILTLVPVVKAIGRKGRYLQLTSNLVKSDVDRLLHPSIFSKILFYIRIITSIPAKFFRKQLTN